MTYFTLSYPESMIAKVMVTYESYKTDVQILTKYNSLLAIFSNDTVDLCF
uniref:Uncharacterized protein n=1 Tax=Arion vulgaris TaxID=1028688 RepID=A0A0B7A1D1_9EUPU